jgi:hypothetical protein
LQCTVLARSWDTSIRARCPRAVLLGSSPEAQGWRITTIDELSDDFGHAVQQAWIEVDVPRCGYCQSGQSMATIALEDLYATLSTGRVAVEEEGTNQHSGPVRQLAEMVERAGVPFDTRWLGGVIARISGSTQISCGLATRYHRNNVTWSVTGGCLLGCSTR